MGPEIQLKEGEMQHPTPQRETARVSETGMAGIDPEIQPLVPMEVVALEVWTVSE
jgi:hypothetical protein